MLLLLPVGQGEAAAAIHGGRFCSEVADETTFEHLIRAATLDGG